MPGLSDNTTAYLFVSYAVEDRAVAERVVTALKARGWNVWWDREIAAGRRFDEDIANRLAHAGAVIVLWSRHSVASEWVREEASSAKGRNVLIPVLIERVEPPFGFTLRQGVDLTSWTGTTASPEFSALARAIRSFVQPVGECGSSSAPGVDRQHGRRPAGSNITAASLMLWLLVIAVMAGGLWYWDAYYRVQVQYFANVTKRDGFPEGIGRLHDSTLARRSVSLALIRHGRRNPVDEVRLVNATGNTPPVGTYTPTVSFNDLNPLSTSVVTDFGDAGDILASEFFTVTRVTFSRDANGRILEQTGLNAGGRSVYTLHYGSPDTAEYKRHGFANPIRASGIAYLKFSRVRRGPNAGLDETVVYLDGAQKPQPDEDGEFGHRLALNGLGLVGERFNLGPDMKDRPNNHGLLKSKVEYDALGNVLHSSNVGPSGDAVLGQLGNASMHVQYDAFGNLTRAAFYDRGGGLVTIRGIGAAGAKYTYDDMGRLTKQTLFGADERPVVGPNGFATMTFEWLAPTRALVRFSDPDERPLPILGTAFEVVTTWDAHGLPIENTYRNRKSEPTRTSEGCSTIVQARDEQGNVADYRCLNEDRAPTISTAGYSSWRAVFDDRALPLTTTYFDPTGKPGLQGESYTSARQEYTSLGKVATITFLDSLETPRKTREGYASIGFTYDDRGNRVREQYFDEDGRPTTIVGGYASQGWEYDARNREKRVSYFGTDGQLVTQDDGYAAIDYDVDERGFLTKWTFLDLAGRPVRSMNGFAIVRIKRNERGQPLEFTYFDEHGRATVNTRTGSGQRRLTYNPRGKVLERSDFDVNGRPTTNAYGYATLRFSYDEYGQEVGREVVDATGRSLRSKVIVDRVTRGSVGADAGFRAADIILTYDGEDVTTSDHFTNRLELFRGDRPREVRVERDKRVVGLEIPPGRIGGLTLEEKVYPSATR